MSEASDNLMKARCRLMIREPFYGSIAMDMTWREDKMDYKDVPEDAKTMGVRLTNTGAECIYYKPFVDSLTVEELYTVVQHEIEHLVRLHCLRKEHRHHELFNVACDMSIHGHKGSPKIGYTEYGKKPVFPMADQLCWVPDDVDPNLTAEEYYKQMTDKIPKIKMKCTCGQGHGDDQGQKNQQEGKGDGQGDDQDQQGTSGGSGKKKPKKGQKKGQGGAEGDKENCPIHGKKLLDSHWIWDMSETSEDEARQLVNSMVQNAITKNQGSIPGHLLDAVQALGKPIVRWRELLRRYLGQHVGNRRPTLARRHRRNDSFGVKGVSHHAAATVNVIVDTSGSIGQEELSKFFAEIDAIASRAKTNVLQWDHDFQGYSQYRRGNWKKFKVNGRGGTDMAAPYKWLEDNGKIADVQVMLTDGHCNWADSKGYPVITCITTDQQGPSWGHVVRLV
jgi:predicted metal-dependent peptidase